jgi:hypothetical protein
VAASVVAAGVGLAGGSLGQHRLAVVGGSPIQVWGAVFAEALVCSVVGVVALRIVLILRGGRDRPLPAADRAVPAADTQLDLVQTVPTVETLDDDETTAEAS